MARKAKPKKTKRTDQSNAVREKSLNKRRKARRLKAHGTSSTYGD